MTLEAEPKIGDVRQKVLPSGQKERQIFVACLDCGKTRWVRLIKGEPERLRCHICATARSWKNPQHRENRTLGLIESWDGNEVRRESMREKMSGTNNVFFGKHHPPEMIERLAKLHEVDVNVKPTGEWGYFIGLVLGDGSISKTAGGNLQSIRFLY